MLAKISQRNVMEHEEHGFPKLIDCFILEVKCFVRYPICCFYSSKQELYLYIHDYSIDDQFDELGMDLDVPFVPTDDVVIKAMLEMAEVDANDVLYDLGSGDGRIVVAAAKNFGAQAVGVEIDAGRVALSEAYAAQMGVEDRVCFIEDDLFAADYSPATVVTMYLLHTVNLELRPRLLNELRPGTRIVSHAFDMGDWKPDKKTSGGGTAIFLWIVPAKVAGEWRWETAEGKEYRAIFQQNYQRLSGELWVDDEPVTILSSRVWGTLLEVVVQYEDAYEPETIVMHYHENRLIIVGEHQAGVVAQRIA